MSPPETSIEILLCKRNTAPDIPWLPPQKMSEEAAAYDIRAYVNTPRILEPGARALIPTGFALAIPPGYEAQIRPRSGLAFKHGITVLNSPGTIDSDYRGEIGVLLINHGDLPFAIEPGMRIAQMLFSRLCNTEIVMQDSLESSDRNEGGFGSTGTT